MNQIDYAELYRNKLIDAGEYLAQVVSVDVAKQQNGTTSYQIGIVLDGNQLPAEGTKLTAILHTTPKAKKFFDAFLDAYRVTEDSVQTAVGRYAGVYVYQTEYKGTFYSALKFHPQPFKIQEIAREMENNARWEGGHTKTPDTALTRTGLAEWI